MAVAAWVKEMLDRANVPYQLSHHRRAATALAVAEREHVSGRRVAKTVVVLAPTRPILLVLPATRWVDLDVVAEIAGVPEARLATEEEIEAIFTDSEVGAVPPLKHWTGIPVWVDPSLQADDVIVFQGGSHTDCVRVRFEDWFRLVRPRIETFTA